MKILYCLAGEGMGHAIRCDPIIARLVQKHSVRICCGGKSYIYFSKKFPDVVKIGSFHLIYRKNKVSRSLTFLYHTFRFPYIMFTWLRLLKTYFSYKPDLIISDFEPLSAYMAILLRKKILTIDNLHSVTHIEIDYPKKFWLDALLSKFVVRLVIPKSHKRIITTYFFEKPKGNTYLVHPILRDNITRLKPKKGNRYLIYQTSKSNKKLLDEIDSIDAKFIVYGFGIDKKTKNAVFKKNNEKEFFNDLKNCKAVITNGGFTLIGEALYLKKPILSIPVKAQFEQILNAVYLDKLGYGMHIEEFSKASFLEFEKNIARYDSNLKKYSPKNQTDDIIEMIEQAIQNKS